MNPGKGHEEPVKRIGYLVFSSLHIFIGKVHDFPENDRIKKGKPDIHCRKKKG